MTASFRLFAVGPFRLRKVVIPADSCHYECSAVGFTSKRSEKWPFDGEKRPVHVEAVALQPTIE